MFGREKRIQQLGSSGSQSAGLARLFVYVAFIDMPRRGAGPSPEGARISDQWDEGIMVVVCLI